MNQGVTILPVEERADAARRLEKRVERRGPDECWPWQGSTTKGYGRIRLGRSNTRAHRLVFMLRYALVQLPRKLDVCHSCDVPGCCNPAHLFLGTQQANVADTVAKGRQSRIGCGRRGSAHPASKLTEDQVRTIRASDVSSEKLAPMFGVCASVIRQIRRGETWRHVE